MVSIGEISRMGMALGIDPARVRGSVTPQEESNNIRSHAVDFLTNTLNIPGDNRQDINTILRRAHQTDTRIELSCELRRILGYDESRRLISEARRSGYFSPDQGIDIVEAILYNQMNETDLQDAMDIWLEGEPRGAIAGYNDWEYLRAGAFDRLFDFSDTPSAVGLMLTIAGLLVLRRVSSPLTIMRICSFMGWVGLFLGLGEAGFGIMGLNNTSNGADRSERLRSIGGGIAMAVASGLPILTRWGQRGEAIQNIRESELTRSIYRLFGEIRGELSLMREAGDRVIREESARRIIPLADDLLVLLGRVGIEGSRRGNEMYLFFQNLLTEARGILSLQNTRATPSTTTITSPERSILGLALENSSRWSQMISAGLSNFGRQTALTSACLFTGGTLGTSSGSKILSPFDAVQMLESGIHRIKQSEGLIATINSTLESYNREEGLAYLRQLIDILELAWNNGGIKIRERDMLRVALYLGRQIEERVGDVRVFRESGITGDLWNLIRPLTNIVAQIETQLLRGQTLAQEASLFNQRTLAPEDTSIHALAYIYELMGRIGSFHYMSGQNPVLSAIDSLIINLSGAIKMYEAIGEQEAVERIMVFLRTFIANDIDPILSRRQNDNHVEIFRALQALDENFPIQRLDENIISRNRHDIIKSVQGIIELGDKASFMLPALEANLDRSLLLRGIMTRDFSDALSARAGQVSSELLSRSERLATEAEEYVERFMQVLGLYTRD
ncbi:MAG: hypothetical protein ABH859_00885 [Pseudomonadota bacterium]